MLTPADMERVTRALVALVAAQRCREGGETAAEAYEAHARQQLAELLADQQDRTTAGAVLRSVRVQLDWAEAEQRIRDRRAAIAAGQG